MPLCYPQELWRNQGQLGIVLMRLSRGQNKVPHQGPAFCYQHHCPTLIWAAGGTGWRICQWSGKGDVDTWLLLIRTWTHSAHHAASRWWLYKAHKPCSFVTRLFSNSGAIRNTYSQTSLVGGTSLYFHMWLLSAGWNLDKLRSQPGWLYWNPAEEKSRAAKPPFCFTLPGRGQPHSASGPNLFPNCISIHTDSIQRSAATVCDEECSALETQCCHCDPLPLPRASSPLFPLNARKGLRSLKWKLPLNPNHLKHGCRLMLLTISDSERHSFSTVLQKNKK